MKNHAQICVVVGFLAAFFAIVLNLAATTGARSAMSLAIESVIAGLIALVCGSLTFRRGGGWRFSAIAMIGPGVFVLADATMRLLFMARHGV